VTRVTTVVPRQPSSEDSQRRLLYGIPEAADLLSLGRSSMYRMVLDRRVRTVRLGGRRLIPHSELLRLVDQLMAEAEAVAVAQNV
jgi:excisionase family DNA binding protein